MHDDQGTTGSGRAATHCVCVWGGGGWPAHAAAGPKREAAGVQWCAAATAAARALHRSCACDATHDGCKIGASVYTGACPAPHNCFTQLLTGLACSCCAHSRAHQPAAAASPGACAPPECTRSQNGAVCAHASMVCANATCNSRRSSCAGACTGRFTCHSCARMPSSVHQCVWSSGGRVHCEQQRQRSRMLFMPRGLASCKWHAGWPCAICLPAVPHAAAAAASARQSNKRCMHAQRPHGCSKQSLIKRTDWSTLWEC